MATIKSIEEKAKCYDEAVEKLRRLHDNYDTVSTLIDIKEELENIFPELKESEDERIRKSIIGFLITISSLKDGKTISNEDFDSKAILEWVAWLEKQKDMEAKLIISDEGYNKAFKDGVEDVLTNLHKYGLEKQGEHKLAEDIERKYDPCYNMSFEEAQEYISNRGFDIPWTDCNVFVDFRYVTQTVANILRWADDNPRHKPEWSEKDEDTLHCIIDAIDSLDIRTNTNGEHEDHTEEIYWLKSLKDRVQPKQERSEEDEKMLNNIIKDLVHPWNEYIPDRIEDEIKWLKNRLKSLKPQNRWKPSDEQMADLWNMVCECRPADQQLLQDLYFGLKTLRGE